MKVKVLRPFIDLTDGIERKVGEVFECTSARFSDITSKLPEWIEEVEETNLKTTTKKKTAKKTEK